MKKILTVLLAVWLALMPASFGDDNPFAGLGHFWPFWPGIFHCNGVPIVCFSKGFWVSKDWQCPHFGFFYRRGFYVYGYPYSYTFLCSPTWMYGTGLYPGYYPHPYMYGIYPAYPGAEKEEPWYKFIQRYLKEHPEQEKEK